LLDDDRAWVLQEASLGIIEAVAYRPLCSVRCLVCGEPTLVIPRDGANGPPGMPEAILEHRSDCPIGLLMVGCDWETRDLEHRLMPHKIGEQ
jgi:hypothetical protein